MEEHILSVEKQRGRLEMAKERPLYTQTVFMYTEPFPNMSEGKKKINRPSVSQDRLRLQRKSSVPICYVFFFFLAQFRELQLSYSLDE